MGVQWGVKFTRVPRDEDLRWATEGNSLTGFRCKVWWAIAFPPFRGTYAGTVIGGEPFIRV
jgi:hypothetical protein